MLKFSQATSQIYFPNPESDQVSQCTHLGVGAHQDDLEVMASHGILSCLNDEDKNFIGVTSTSGGGSAREGAFKDMTDEKMKKVRSKEQNESAKLGQFLCMIQLGFESGRIKEKINQDYVNDLKEIITKTQPEVIYTHNLADKHKTHVAVSLHLIHALRQLNYQPQHFYGCEVWRGLDWLPDTKKVPLEIKNPQLIAELIQCHESQTEGGKRYDLATLGRLKANATFFESHKVDHAKNIWFAMDLMPLLLNKNLLVKDFVNEHLVSFQKEVMGPLDSF